MQTRTLTPTAFALALTFCGAGRVSAAVPSEAGDLAQLHAHLQAAGYQEVRDLELDDGLWEAEVRRADGRWGEIVMDPVNGEVFDALSGRPLLAIEDVLVAIEAAGYRQIHDLDRDGALWEAEAMDADGQPVELRISGHDGRILSARAERDD